MICRTRALLCTIGIVLSGAWAGEPQDGPREPPAGAAAGDSRVLAGVESLAVFEDVPAEEARISGMLPLAGDHDSLGSVFGRASDSHLLVLSGRNACGRGTTGRAALDAEPPCP